MASNDHCIDSYLSLLTLFMLYEERLLRAAVAGDEDRIGADLDVAGLFDAAAERLFRQLGVFVPPCEGIAADVALNQVDPVAVRAASLFAATNTTPRKRFLASGVCGKKTSFSSSNCTTLRAIVTAAMAVNATVVVIDARRGCIAGMLLLNIIIRSLLYS